MISLIGLPGSGKSTVGRQLSHQLELPFIDSDFEIEQRIGCSIAEYFECAGEDRFRNFESSVIDELTQRPEGVLSTGGGVVLRQKNRDYLHHRTYVIYLNSSPTELWRRLQYDKTRPLLQVADPLARLRELHAQRDPLYRETAHFCIDTGRPAAVKLAHAIMMQLERVGRGGEN
jgi:shikimate kinase